MSNLHQYDSDDSLDEDIKRPTITFDHPPEDWSYFLHRWSCYKKLAKPSRNNTVKHLLKCCGEELQNYLMSMDNRIESRDEDTVLALIKQHAVREEGLTVSRFKLFQMKQERGEPIQSYVCRLKGKASICEFIGKLRCTHSDEEHEYNYSDTVVKMILVSGLADEKIQMKILCNEDQKMSLSEMVKFIQRNEVVRDTVASINHMRNIRL